MDAPTFVAHVGGLPVEEIVFLALAAGGTATAGIRVAWLAHRDRHRRRRVLRGRRTGA